MNKFETRLERLLIVDNWFRKEKPLGPGKKGTFEKQTQMTKELKEIVKNVDFYRFDISILNNYDYNFRDEGSAASREKHRTIARSLLIDIFETYMIYFSEFKYNDGSSPNLTEQQKSDILNEIYEAFHIYLGEKNQKLFASGICICNSYSFCKNYKESN